MQIELTKKEFRKLLDLVYLGNWFLNSIRGDERFREYDEMESKIFGLCHQHGMGALVETVEGEHFPSQAYVEGGIQQVVACYEDTVFYEILAEELSRRDMGYAEITEENYDEILGRMSRYMSEFEASGLDHLTLEN